jgi:Protein of unknown function (DUF2939)
MRLTTTIGAAVLALCLAYAAWPYFGVYELVAAVQARDVAAVNERIDFPALRRSLTAQLVRTYLRITGKGGRPGSVLEQFAVGFGATVADPIVAKLVAPEALLDLLRDGRPSGVFSDNVPSIEGVSTKALGNIWRLYWNSELRLGKFFVAVPVDKPRADRFRLEFCLAGWTWRLCGTELPEQLQVRLVQEILKTEQRRPSGSGAVPDDQMPR